MTLIWVVIYYTSIICVIFYTLCNVYFRAIVKIIAPSFAAFFLVLAWMPMCVLVQKAKEWPTHGWWHMGLMEQLRFGRVWQDKGNYQTREGDLEVVRMLLVGRWTINVVAQLYIQMIIVVRRFGIIVLYMMACSSDVVSLQSYYIDTSISLLTQMTLPWWNSQSLSTHTKPLDAFLTTSGSWPTASHQIPLISVCLIWMMNLDGNQWAKKPLNPYVPQDPLYPFLHFLHSAAHCLTELQKVMRLNCSCEFL